MNSAPIRCYASSSFHCVLIVLIITTAVVVHFFNAWSSKRVNAFYDKDICLWKRNLADIPANAKVVLFIIIQSFHDEPLCSEPLASIKILKIVYFIHCNSLKISWQIPRIAFKSSPLSLVSYWKTYYGKR